MNIDVSTFYANKFTALTDKTEIDLSFLPPISRRRTSLFDKAALHCINKACGEETESIILSSRYGEFERLISLIEQYRQNNEVSPNMFSGSVHNYALGMFLLNKQKPLHYNALSGYKNTVSNGLISAVISEYDNVLFCYADIINDAPVAFALNITRHPAGEKYVIKFENNDDTEDTAADYIDFFGGGIDILSFPMFTLERGK